MRRVGFKEPKLPSGLTFSSMKVILMIWSQKKTGLQPAWQNSIDSITRDISAYKTRCFDNENLWLQDHWSILRWCTILVVKEHTGDKIGSALLSELLKNNQYPTFKIVNIESTTFPQLHFWIFWTGGHRENQYERLLDLDHNKNSFVLLYNNIIKINSLWALNELGLYTSFN